jgi:hypothetical protein
MVKTMANRVLHGFEKKQRGCQYCLHVTTFRHNGEIRNACPFDQCPYEVLGKYKTFEEFMASEDSQIPVTEFFTSVAGCYEHSTPNTVRNRVFSDGDARLHI